MIERNLFSVKDSRDWKLAGLLLCFPFFRMAGNNRSDCCFQLGISRRHFKVDPVGNHDLFIHSAHAGWTRMRIYSRNTCWTEARGTGHRRTAMTSVGWTNSVIASIPCTALPENAPSACSGGTTTGKQMYIPPKRQHKAMKMTPKVSSVVIRHFANQSKFCMEILRSSSFSLWNRICSELSTNFLSF